MAYSPPGSSVHGILQAKLLEWVAISFSGESSQSKDWTWTSCTASGFFTNWTTSEAQIFFNKMIRINIEKSSVKCLYNKKNDTASTSQMCHEIFQNSLYCKISTFSLLTGIFCSVLFKRNMMLCLWECNGFWQTCSSPLDLGKKNYTYRSLRSI